MIWAVADQVMRQHRKHRMQVALLAFVGLMMATSLLFSSLSQGKEFRVITDIGLAGAEVLGFMIIVFGMVLFFTEELEGKGATVTLCRPIKRYEYLLGWVLGILLTLALYLVFMGLFIHGFLLAFGGSAEMTMVWELLLIFFKLSLTMVASLLATLVVTSLPMVLIMTASVYLIGHITYHLRLLAQQLGVTSVEWLATILGFLLPNFHLLEVIDVVMESGFSSARVLAGALYAVAYGTVCLSLSVLVFQKKEF